MNDVLKQEFSRNKVYMSPWFTIVIGVSKIVCATMLMLLYSWHMNWDQKFWSVLIFVIISGLTYLAEYGISWFWWPRYMGTFWKDGSDQRFIVCADSPFFSGEYKIEIYPAKSMSFFQKLGKPVVDETFKFEMFFTESGYFASELWRIQCERMVSTALKYKTE